MKKKLIVTFGSLSYNFKLSNRKFYTVFERQRNQKDVAIVPPTEQTTDEGQVDTEKRRGEHV